MIPVFQTRYAVETFGNCFEACLASILELPLGAVPDRAALVDADAWADRCAQARIRGGEDAVLDLDLPAEYAEGEQALREWLLERGLAWLDLEIGSRGMREKDWLDLAAKTIVDYWIGSTRYGASKLPHATVWRGRRCDHNPSRGGPLTDLGPLHNVVLLVAVDPARVARLMPLPDIAAELERVAGPHTLRARLARTAAA